MKKENYSHRPARLRWAKKNPWFSFLHNARTRCRYESHRSYKQYGGRGIKCLLTFEEIKILWARDNAHLLVRPSLDRISSNDHYTFENCQFIELAENIAKSNREREMAEEEVPF